MDLGLKDMRVLVAASSSGLGAATALHCALEGARVAINGRKLDKLAKTSAYIRDATHADVLAIPGDVAHPNDARRLVEDAARQMGGLDVLVTNAGGPPAGSFDAIKNEDWQKAFDLTVMSTVNLIRAALPILRLSNNPSILAITGVSIKQPIENLLLSNSLRSAVAGFIKTLSQEVGPYGVRVNAIMPGWTRTDRVTYILKQRAEKNETSVQAVLKDITSNIPLGRMAEPDEFGKVAAFLVSPAASFIHGAMIPVDGGEIRATL